MTRRCFGHLKSKCDLIVSAVLFLSPSLCLAADNPPVTGIIDDGKVMSRVQLVGVIADGTAKNAGIAVIKDSETGRSYALRTGDSLPGVNHIILTNVKREGLEFSSSDQKYLVRPFINVDSSQEGEAIADKTSSNDEKTEKNLDGPGLFEKWASGQSETDSGGISLDAIKALQKKFESLDKEDAARAALRTDTRGVSTSTDAVDSADGVIYEEDFPEDQ